MTIQMEQAVQAVQADHAVQAEHAVGGHQADIDAVEPRLQLDIDVGGPPARLRCVGTLDTGTRHHIFQAVDELVAGHPTVLEVDVTALRVAGADGASVLTRIEHLAREANTALRWIGLDAGRLGGPVPRSDQALRGQ